MLPAGEFSNVLNELSTLLHLTQRHSKQFWLDAKELFCHICIYLKIMFPRLRLALKAIKTVCVSIQNSALLC